MTSARRLLILLSIAASAAVSAPPSSLAAVEGGPRLGGSAACMSRNATIDAGNVVLSDLRAKGGSCRSARRTVRRIDTSAGNAKLPGHLCRQVAGAGDGAWFRCTRSRVTLQFYLGL